MCLAVPHRITRLLEDGMAVAAAGSVETEIRTDLVPGVSEGDLVLVHAGFAIEQLQDDEGQEIEELWAEVRRLSETPDA